MCAVLAEATLRMIEGQMIWPPSEALATNEQNLRALQTERLYAFARIRGVGRLSAKAFDITDRALNAWASHLGDLFTPTDDPDATASTETMGKRTGKDEGKSKLTGVRVRAARLRDRSKTAGKMPWTPCSRLVPKRPICVF